MLIAGTILSTKNFCEAIHIKIFLRKLSMVFYGINSNAFYIFHYISFKIVFICSKCHTA